MRIPPLATVLLGMSLVAGAPAVAQSPTPGGMPPPAGMSLAHSAAMRFPQPVLAGVLPGRDVLEPTEAQTVFGRVRSVIRQADGTVALVIVHGGFVGLGRRPIAVPIDAMVLLGADMQVAAFTPDQLRQFPPFTPAGTTPVPDDTVLRIGLAKPFH